jgi:pantothenate kinase
LPTARAGADIQTAGRRIGLPGRWGMRGLKSKAILGYIVFMQLSGIKFPAILQVTEQPVDISAFSKGQKDFYLNLFCEVVETYRAKNKFRAMIGIAGPTGAGKSVMAVLLKEIARQAGIPFGWESVTIDAYHYPNQFLLSHFSGGEPLKQVKGRFDTYDVPALVRDLKAFAAGENVLFPVYSRKLHDPVKNGIGVMIKNVLLIVEGLWLLYDQSGWEAIGPLLDFTFFIEADKAKTQAPVIRRHMTGGRTFEDAARYYERVDGRNSDLVLTTKHKADKVIAPYYSVR